LEVNGKGITINSIISYLKSFIKEYLKSINNGNQKLTIYYETIAKDNFLEELKKLKRSIVAKVSFNKSLIGSEALNFSDRTENLQNDITLILKAERNQSITETAIDFFNKFNGQNVSNSISNIRIEGKDKNNDNIILDTSFMEKIEFANVSLNSNTGEVQTVNILSLLKTYLINL